jgi:microcystin-dependent protein
MKIFSIIFILLIIIIYNYCISSRIEESFSNINSNKISSLASIINQLKTNNSNIKNSDISSLLVTGSITSNGTILTPIGTIAPFVGNDIPIGWLKCDGTVIDKKYSELIKLLGGNNNTPNINNRVIVGADTGIHLTNRPLATVGGEETVTLSVAQMPNHTHSMNSDGSHKHSHRVSHQNKHCDGNKINTTYHTRLENTKEAGGHGHTIDGVGGNQPHTNMMPYIALNYIICAA